MKEMRSGIAPENIDEILEAEDSAKWAVLQGQQQYYTPPELAEKLWKRLPSMDPTTLLDPQMGEGALLKPSYSYRTRKYGFDIDNRLAEKSDYNTDIIIGNCVKVFEVMDDLYPDLKFECIVANPPFAKRWKVGDKVVDSTEYTWQQCIKRGCYGFFISNKNTIEKLGIDKHASVYHYETYADVWPNCNVVIGVVWWKNKDAVATLPYDTIEPWKDIEQVIREESAHRSTWNIWLGDDGKLTTYLSTRVKLKRKLGNDEILQLHRIKDCHPLALTPERETRKLMQHLIECGFYSIQPEAQAAIEDALVQVNKLACPIMPPTEFELVAYTDEQESLECIHKNNLNFTPGKKYEITTATYQFRESFTRSKIHYNEKDETTYTLPHECSLSGQDRFIAMRDDHGKQHRFMDKPDPEREHEHEEGLLWKVFKRPDVRTIADEMPAAVEHNRSIMRSLEMMAGFEYYPGQKEYLCRVAAKDAAIVAADTGCGKTLLAISLVALKAPERALVIAPQGTIRSEDDDEGEVEYQASQWVGELRKFAPYLQVFELFSMEDYQRILGANGGKLPPGVFVTYYEGFFKNKARESCPPSWNDEKYNLYAKVKFGLPPLTEHPSGDKDGWARTIGEERNGIRCICEPSMSTLIGREFDMVLLDEGHLCCHLTACVSQMLVRLQPRYRYVLSATPIPNLISNIFSLMGWTCVPDWYKGDLRNAAWPYARHEIGRFEDTFLSYERDHTQEQINRSKDPAWKGKCVKKSPVISSPARLLKILKPTMAFISKIACNPNLVSCKVIDVRVPMGKEQAKLYGHFLNRGNIKCAHPLIRARKQIAYLRGICADPMGFEHGGPAVSSNFNPKTVAILELLREILGRGEQAVVVCARVGQTNTLCMKLNEVGVPWSRIDSTVLAADQSRQSNMFKAGRTRVMLMGIKCAIGHSYDDCPNLIIGSLEYSYGSKHQAEGRIYRVNSKRPINIYCILHEKSIEETMFDVVATKQDAATICLHGQRIPRDFKPVDMQEILAEASERFQLNGQPMEMDCELQWAKLRGKFNAIPLAA